MLLTVQMEQDMLPTLHLEPNMLLTLLLEPNMIFTLQFAEHVTLLTFGDKHVKSRKSYSP
jgi:hypothetical protein